ncbi:MAG: hypothetical protein WCV92_01880 [Candidatus Buchananbacteria bacterium]
MEVTITFTTEDLESVAHLERAMAQYFGQKAITAIQLAKSSGNPITNGEDIDALLAKLMEKYG